VNLEFSKKYLFDRVKCLFEKKDLVIFFFGFANYL